MEKFLSEDELDFANIENPNDWKKEWKDMPEYYNEDLSPHRSLIVHFTDEKAVQDFMKATGLKLTEKSKFAWYPKLNEIKCADKYYE
jgi:dTDP-4-amino-4,6-dideoxygalactose transaminase